MSIPLRLTADLGFALVARSIGVRGSHLQIVRLSPDLLLNSDSVAGSPDRQSAVSASSHSLSATRGKSHARMIWIGGSEPLDFPDVASFANALAASGRHVFLETSGASLKPRLHEFRPSSRFYFAIRFDVPPAPRGSLGPSESAFRAGLEALRMARLAGFFTCANLVFHPKSSASSLESLHSEIRALDIDGVLITLSATTPELQEQVRLARRKLLARRWSLLSSLLDGLEPQELPQPAQDFARQSIPESQQNGLGEGAEAG